jgi:hypothetical protein
MLAANKYPKDYVDASRTKVEAQIASYRVLIAGVKDAAVLADFQRRFFSHMLLALDTYFVHRTRALEGKDGNALNEVRMLCNGVMLNDGVLAEDKTIKFTPEKSVTKLKIGDRIVLDTDTFAALVAAFFTQLERKFV